MRALKPSGLGLNLNVDNRYYSGDVAAGHILTQSPAPGTVVRREWQVRVSESLGPQKVDVPETVGHEERVAELELRRAGLEVGTVARLPYPNAAEGTVIAQDPPAHAQDIAKPTVNLLVAAPDDETVNGYVMPDLTGLPVVSAQACNRPKWESSPRRRSMSACPCLPSAAATHHRFCRSGPAL